MPDEMADAAAADDAAAAAANADVAAEAAAPAGDVPVSRDTILLDIYQRLGRVESQNDRIIDELAEASDGRRRLYQEVGALRQDFRDDGQEIRDQVADVRTKIAVLTVRVDRIDGQVGELAPLVKGAEDRRRRLADLVGGIGTALSTDDRRREQGGAARRNRRRQRNCRDWIDAGTFS